MDIALRTLLSVNALTVKEISASLTRSETWVREALKKHSDEIEATNSTVNPRVKVFFIYAPKNETPTEEDVTETPPGEARASCPFCYSRGIHPAGDADSFLGSALTCADCKRTFNTFTGEEIIDAPNKTATKAKRQLLNPQNKTNAKVAAVEAVGGKLFYDRAERLWTLASANRGVLTFTALQISTMTPEALAAKSI